MTRLFIVAGVRLYREGLAHALTGRGLEVVGIAGHWAEASGPVRELRPDIALLDLGPSEDIDVVRQAVRAQPETKVIVLAIPDAERDVIVCAEAGVAGYVTREQSLEDLLSAIESVVRGELLCSPRDAAVLMRRVSALAAQAGPRVEAHLTPRELEIVELIGEGLSNKLIAQRLCIELATVKNHVHHILEKLQVHGRLEAVALVRGGGAGT